jgi:putative component of membrane protein insertase Oxa1/YidC/SpoIIIJ protein YidD
MVCVGVITVACRPGVRVGTPCPSAPVFAPFDEHRHDLPDDLRGDLPDGVLDAIVAWYQHHGRTRELPGAGCPFAPTCSAYARAALQRYGPIAMILIVDRLLVREHVAAGDYYPAICVEHTTRLSDGVP